MAKKRARKGRSKGTTTKTTRAAAKGKSRVGRRYSDAERQQILDTAKRENLTGKQVAERFGVSTLSYYTWRKKGAPAKRRGRPPGAKRNGQRGDLALVLRNQIQTEIRRRLPDIIAEEIAKYFR